MTKPMIVGMTILNKSKIPMLEFHHDFMLKELSPEKFRILYTDTDSFVYELQCDDAYALIRANKNRFDTSDFSLDNPYNIKRFNKKVVGKMHDEYKGEIITEFIGLRSKMYAVKTFKNKVLKKGKGIKKNVLKRKISFADYKRCMVKKRTSSRAQTRLQSSRHNVYTLGLKPHGIWNFFSNRTTKSDLFYFQLFLQARNLNPKTEEIIKMGCFLFSIINF